VNMEIWAQFSLCDNLELLYSSKVHVEEGTFLQSTKSQFVPASLNLKLGLKPVRDREEQGQLIALTHYNVLE
jgi:hypothetical protein